jgi:FMN phosphatase YigB (HAD superfamily)
MGTSTAPLRRLEGVRLLSTDVFDTVLLRDGSTETQRFAIAATRSARLLGIDAAALRRLRWDAQVAAYRAVAMADPGGEASLERIAAAIARTLGLAPEAATLLHDTEVAVDIEHLRPNRPLVEAIVEAKASGVRTIALSDTSYAKADLRRMFAAVLPTDPYDEVYVSSELGRTKHEGSLFPLITETEGIAPSATLHLGDHPSADIRRAEAAGWRTVHLPRGRLHRAQKLVGGSRALLAHLERGR